MKSNRVLLLLKKQWLESRKAWLIGALAIAAILSFLFVLIDHWRTSFNGDTTNGIFLLLLFIGGGLFMAGIFKDLGNQQKGVWFLILPASAFEKLIVALGYGILAYLFTYLGIFYTIQEVMLLILGSDGLHRVDLFKNGFYQFVFMFVNFQSVILLGSIFFNKSQFLKTVLVIITGEFLVYNGNNGLLKLITREKTITSNAPLDSFQFVYHNENMYVHSPPGIQLTMNVVSWLIIPVTLWLITWYRIKEKEL